MWKQCDFMSCLWFPYSFLILILLCIRNLEPVQPVESRSRRSCIKLGGKNVSIVNYFGVIETVRKFIITEYRGGLYFSLVYTGMWLLLGTSCDLGFLVSLVKTSAVHHMQLLFYIIVSVMFELAFWHYMRRRMRGQSYEGKGLCSSCCEAKNSLSRVFTTCVIVDRSHVNGRHGMYRISNHKQQHNQVNYF